MFRGIFVTGTDTNVGKTASSAALMLRYRDEAPLRYWKPIQTGIEQDDDSAEVARLAECRPDEVLNCGVRLAGQVSPHLAARRAGRYVAVRHLVDILRAQPSGTRWIVEGAGGALVPLNDRESMLDLMVALGLPVLVVAPSTLGTINHTRLTVEALRRRKLKVVGVVMVGPRDEENRAAIEWHAAAEVVGQMPHFDALTPAALEDWVAAEFDRSGVLFGCLG
jgi:dethiobiotin synthetase